MTGVVEPDYEVFQLDKTGNSLSAWWKDIKSWNPTGDNLVKETEISFELLLEIEKKCLYKKNWEEMESEIYL